MSELHRILDLWKRARADGEEVCLATIVAFEGSSYRKPGARMLMTRSGLRAGTISGGCLEAEIAKKAWWLTENGASIQRYSSFFDEDTGVPFGLGCGGTVVVLLERGVAAEASLRAVRRCVEERSACAIISAVSAEAAGIRLVIGEECEIRYEVQTAGENLHSAACETLRCGASRSVLLNEQEFYAEYLAPPPALFIFGAGDDAVPLVEFAHALGWHLTVADGRSQLARPERFPLADRVFVIRGNLAEDGIDLGPSDSAVVMTHSFEQDRRLLRELLPRRLAYLGVLGPRLRTERLLSGVEEEIGLSLAECLSRLHTPVGLDIGAHNPAVIALSIAAEIQAVLSGREAAQRQVQERSTLSMQSALHA